MKKNNNRIGGIRVYTLDELSKQLEIHVVTLQRYIREGRILARKVGRRYLVSQDALEKFLTPTSPPEVMERQKRLFK